MLTLRPHQAAALEWLRGRTRAYVMDAPRVGKTAPALLWAAEAGGRCAIICPAGVVTNWQRELARWAPGLEAQVLSYNMLTRRRVEADTVILDEAHYCKSLTAQRTKASLALARRARRVLLLSGTPTPNGPHELWAPLAALWPEELRASGLTTYEGWLNETCVWRRVPLPHNRGMRPQVFAARRSAFLERWLAEFALRRTFRDVYGTTPLVWGTEYLDLTVPRSVRDAALPPRVQAALAAGELPPEDGELAAVRRELGTLKAPVAAALLDAELTDDPGRKVLVGAWHLDVLDALERGLAAHGVVRIDGSVSAAKRDAARDRFNSDPSVRVCVAQLQACAEGISLSGADEVVMVEQAWVPSVNEQFAARPLVMGRATVPVRVLLAPDTIDEAVARVVERRSEVVEDALTQGAEGRAAAAGAHGGPEARVGAENAP